VSRKDQILDALIVTFNEKGFKTDFSMSELADCVGIGKSTLYEYFSNKDEILKDAVIKYVNLSIESVNIGSELVDLPFEEAFKKQLVIILSVASKSRNLLETINPGFVQKLPETMREEMKQKMESTRDQIRDRFISFFAKGMKEGIFDPNVDIKKASVVTSLVVGSIITFSDPNLSIDIDEFVDNIYEGVLKIMN
jgi:AcrR family transcriptional regulator